jgi:hypothetical protein
VGESQEAFAEQPAEMPVIQDRRRSQSANQPRTARLNTISAVSRLIRLAPLVIKSAGCSTVPLSDFDEHPEAASEFPPSRGKQDGRAAV